MGCLVFLQQLIKHPLTLVPWPLHTSVTHCAPCRGLHARVRGESYADSHSVPFVYDDALPTSLAPPPRLLCRQSGVHAKTTERHSAPPPFVQRPNEQMIVSGSERPTDPPHRRWRTTALLRIAYGCLRHRSPCSSVSPRERDSAARNVEVLT